MLSLLETDESSPGQPQLAQLFVAEPVVAVTANPSCSALKARPRRWAAAASFSHHHVGSGAATTHRSLASADCARSILSSACVPPWRSSDSRPGPSAG